MVMRDTITIAHHFRRLMALGLILILFLCGCTDHRSKPTGEDAHIIDLQIINNTVYWLERTDGAFELFCRDPSEKSVVTRFPAVAGITYCKELGCYLYIANGALSAYYPLSDITEKGCDLQANAVLCATEDYILVSTESEDLRVQIENGGKQAVENMPPIDAKILDIYGNVIVFWDADQDSVFQYDCYSDSISKIYSRERNPAVVMIAGMFHNDSFYYAESRGGLHKVFIEDGSITDTLVSTKSVIALARSDSGMIVATKEKSNIVFYSCSSNDELTQLAEWIDTDYIVNGSCLLNASTNKVACAVTSDLEIFEFPSEIAK